MTHPSVATEPARLRTRVVILPAPGRGSLVVSNFRQRGERSEAHRRVAAFILLAEN